MIQVLPIHCIRSGAFDGKLDIYTLFDNLRAETPIWQAPWGDIYLSGYEDVSRVLTDRQFLHRPPQWAEDGLPRRTGIEDWMFYSEGETHTELRQAMQEPFGPVGAVVLRSIVNRVVAKCLSEADIDEDCDIVSTFTRAIPERVIGDLLGVPHEDLAQIRVWSRSIRDLLDHDFPDWTRGQTAQAPEAMSTYFIQHLERLSRKRAQLPPLLAGFPVLINRFGMEIAGRNAAFLAFAGHETTVHLLGNMLYHLAQAPETWKRMRVEPTLVRGAVTETLRLESPVQKVCRWPRQGIMIGQTFIEKDSTVVLLIGAANRDPDRFPAPDHFDLKRTGPPHLAFGRGAHVCVGRSLAEMEGCCLLRALVSRYSSIELIDGSVTWLDNSSFRGLETCRIKFQA